MVEKRGFRCVLAEGSWSAEAGGGYQKGHPISLLEGHLWLPLVGHKLEVGTKGSCWSFIKSWTFWTECYRVIIWLSIVTRDSRLVPGLVTVHKRLAPWAVAADVEGWWSKFYFYIQVIVIFKFSFPFGHSLICKRLSNSGRTKDPDHDTRRLSSCLHNHSSCRIFLILLLYHHGNHLMRELLCRSL